MLIVDTEKRIEQTDINDPQFRELVFKQNDILDPIFDDVMSFTEEEVVWLIRALPGGFHRAELRVIASEILNINYKRG